jgi:uncharacterized protein YkwD
MARCVSWSLVLLTAACGPRDHASTSPPSATPTSIAASDPPSGGGPSVTSDAPTPAPTPGQKLTIPEARRYMLSLINRDRATMSLQPVDLDEGPPTHAGQAHAEDMAVHGFLGHWGTDGSVPEQRMTEAGGADMVLENASCFTDEQARKLDHAPLIDPKNLDQAEDMFFHEQPPHDGHRKNILAAWHRKVGIGIAQPLPTPTEIAVPCISQEFVDNYGTFAAAPRTAHVGQTLHVEGSVNAPATFAGVGLARVDAPKPITVSELNKRRSYPVPKPYQMYWPPGFQTPIPVKVSGPHFSVDVPVSDGGQAGMYELSVWASVPGTKDLQMVSIRTIQVR